MKWMHVIARSGRRFRSGSRGVGLIGVVVATLGSGAAFAHPALEVQAQALSGRIAASPSDRSLRFLRAEVYRLLGRFPEASQDIDVARALGAAPDSAAWWEAALLLEQGRLNEAAGLLRPFDASPWVGLHLVVAQIGARSKESTLELLGLERAIDLDPQVDPEVHRRRAELLRTASPSDQEGALSALDFGLQSLGDVPSLLFLAAQIEADLGRAEAALARLARLESHLERKEMILVRRGDLLRRAGREFDARAAYTEALAALESAPPARRIAPEHLRLEALVREALRREVPSP